MHFAVQFTAVSNASIKERVELKQNYYFPHLVVINIGGINVEINFKNNSIGSV